MPGLRRALVAAAVGLAAAIACSTPDVNFIKEVNAGHCANEVADTEQGESDRDCGGDDCHGCDLGQRCNGPLDCAEGECIDNFCLEPGCLNDAKEQGRIGNVSADPLMTLRAYWDIGGTGARSDNFVFWAAQFVGSEIRWEVIAIFQHNTKRDFENQHARQNRQ